MIIHRKIVIQTTLNNFAPGGCIPNAIYLSALSNHDDFTILKIAFLLLDQRSIQTNVNLCCLCRDIIN